MICTFLVPSGPGTTRVYDTRRHRQKSAEGFQKKNSRYKVIFALAALLYVRPFVSQLEQLAFVVGVLAQVLALDTAFGPSPILGHWLWQLVDLGLERHKVMRVAVGNRGDRECLAEQQVQPGDPP
jgi:hypothetical protein